MAALTSGKLSTIATNLSALRDALDERVGDFDDVVTSTGTALELLDQTWRGPLPDEMEAKVSTYVGQVSGAVSATESARDTIEAWATAATTASETLLGLEQSRAAIGTAMFFDADPDGSLDDELDRINDSIEEEAAAWARTCTTKGGELATSITALQQCTLAEIGTVDERQALLSDSYSNGLAQWAAAHGMDLAILDPTGAMDREAERRLAEFAEGENADLLYALIETMNQADISKMDGKSSRDDWLLSGDPDVVRFRLEIAAELAGIELSEEQLDALTAEAINIAVWGAATTDEGRDAVDDQFDEHTGIEAALDNDGRTEKDVEFGENPSDVDAYVQAWLEAQWEGNPGIFDIAKMILIPDFAVMNPFSDEFHPGWAIVEIIGLVPWTKAGKLLTLARLGSHGDEAAATVRLFDEGTELLSDTGRLADNVPGSTDEILGSGDEVASGGDEVAGAADELARLPRTDPQVVAQIDEVGGPVLDRLQTEVDRIWAETQQALPNASPQQLGTRAHRELEAWIKAHSDELVDPSTGYQVRAEVSFGPDPEDVNGSIIEATRGTKGSIRPDVILERRTVDEFGDEIWEVVEVADLKTGQARISTSWQNKVDNWLSPNNTSEIRPRSPIPVPE